MITILNKIQHTKYHPTAIQPGFCGT